MSYKDPITEAYEAILFEDAILEARDPIPSTFNGMPTIVANFMEHLTTHSIGGEEYAKPNDGIVLTPENSHLYEEYTPISDVIQAGIEAQQKRQEEHAASGSTEAFPGIRKHIENGFRAAFPEDEHPSVTKQKAIDAQKFFREFMAKEGGHAERNTIEIMSQNGKTASSAGAGRNTIGLSLAPHSMASIPLPQRDAGKDERGEKQDGNFFDVCPAASKECRANCLGLKAGGNRQYPEMALRAKVLRQRFVMEHPEHAARLISHEISRNEKFCDEHESLHDKDNNIVGYINKKTGKVRAENAPKGEEGKRMHAAVKEQYANGELNRRPIESGTRLNVTSDLDYASLMPSKFFERHSKTKFYDYTKRHGSIAKPLPSNYTLGLSSTGDGHAESNTHEVIKHLERGGIVAMVYKRGKDQPRARVVKVAGSAPGEKEWPVVDGDNDDNLDQRHIQAAKMHEDLADHHEKEAAKSEGEIKEAHLTLSKKHRDLAEQYHAKKLGVVSGLELKGVKNEDAGHFAHQVHQDGTIWLHDEGPMAARRRMIPIEKA